SIEGTPGSPYSGGIFHILIIIQDYPFKAPKFQFLTPIYHSNVNAHGEICLDILADWFSSCQTLVNLLRSLSSILDSPPLLDPMVPDIAELYVRDRGMWERNAREFTEGFAM
ncbi:ubiquitin-conjugating enzyme/RWD-like protein, partial [Clohesyomyces aquaticus]